MKRYTYANKDDDFYEKRLAVGAIVSEPLLFCLCDESFMKWEYIASEAVSTIVEWCINYYEETGQAPKSRIQDIFEDEVENNETSELKLISRLLTRASKEYERAEHNDSLFVSSAETYFRQRREVVVNQIKAEMIAEREPSDKIAAVEDDYPVPSRTQVTSKSIFRDEDYVNDLLDKSRNRPLFRLPGKLESIFSDSLTRQGFLALLGPEKVGKSWWLQLMAQCAAEGRNNVLFLSAGDMSDDEVNLRLAISINKKSNKKRYCKEHWQPCMDCVLNQKGECPCCDTKMPSLMTKDDELITNPEDSRVPDDYEVHVDEDCEHYQPTTWFEKVPDAIPLCDDKAGAWSKIRRYSKRIKKRGLEVAFYPTGTLTVEEIESLLRAYEANGTIMDVVVIDYADIMADEFTKGEARHIHSTRWKKLRGLAQRHEILIITATQSNRREGQSLLGRDDISEDKSKMAEVTAFYGLNQTVDQKRRGVIGINQFAGRHGDYDPHQQVMVLQNLKRGIVHLDSYISWAYQ
jgi:hypothetical protein